MLLRIWQDFNPLASEVGATQKAREEEGDGSRIGGAIVDVPGGVRYPGEARSR